MLWILLLSFMEVVVAKCTENVISNLNIGYLELASLVSYRFVPLSLLSIILTLTNLSIPYLHLIGLVYLLITDTYYCVKLDWYIEIRTERICQRYVQRRRAWNKDCSPRSFLCNFDYFMDMWYYLIFISIKYQ